MEIYSDPIIRKYKELIESAMPGVFRYIYQGDPLAVPKSNVPALIISKSQTRIGVHTNAEDEHEIRMVMTVITDIRDEASDDQKLVPGIARLYDIMEGRDETTYELKSNTVLDILRSNILIDATHNLRTDLGSITTVDYGLTLGKRDKEALAVEAQIEFIASFNQQR